MATAIVTAAGSARRFGGGKLAALIDGRPLLDHTLASLIEADIDHIIVVIAPHSALSTVSLLEDPRVALVVNLHPERGMFSSIQCGLAEAPDGALLILPGDMPFVRSVTVRAVRTACEQLGRPVAPTFTGRRGHPIALPGALKQPLLDNDATMSLRDVFVKLSVHSVDVAVEDPGVLRDVDVPADLE